MYDMQTNAADVLLCQFAYQLVCLFVTQLHSVLACKTGERIEVVFGVKTLGEQGTLLDGDSDPPRQGGRAFDDAGFAKLLWPLIKDCRLIDNFSLAMFNNALTYLLS